MYYMYLKYPSTSSLNPLANQSIRALQKRTQKPTTQRIPPKPTNHLNNLTNETTNHQPTNRPTISTIPQTHQPTEPTSQPTNYPINKSGLGTGTVYTGSGNLLIDLQGTVYSPVVSSYKTPKKHAILQHGNPLNAFRGGRRDSVLLQSSILVDFEHIYSRY